MEHVDKKINIKEKFGNVIFSINNNNGWVNCLDVLENSFVFAGIL
jgi:hypothetical protein